MFLDLLRCHRGLCIHTRVDHTRLVTFLVDRWQKLATDRELNEAYVQRAVVSFPACEVLAWNVDLQASSSLVHSTATDITMTTLYIIDSSAIITSIIFFVYTHIFIVSSFYYMAIVTDIALPTLYNIGT